MMRLSSSPIAPCSPACGLSAATASRGRAMPNRDLSPAAVMRPARTMTSGVSACTASASDRWMVTGTTRSSGQASIMATSRPAAPARPGTRCGRDGGSPHPAGSSSGSGWWRSRRSRRPAPAWSRARSPRASAAALTGSGWPALAGAFRRTAQHRQRGREDGAPLRRAAAISRTGTARPSLPASAASRAGSSIAKNGRAAACAPAMP